MQKYKFIKTSTAGNRTGYIIGKTAWKNKKEVLSIILRKKNLEAEQYAFLWKTAKNECVMNMAGGEISGGAILASPTILGNFSGKTKIITVGKSLVSFITNKDKNKIYVRTKLPKSIILAKPEKVDFQLMKGFRVKLNGIAYFVTQDTIPSINLPKLFKKLDRSLDLEQFPAIGIIKIINFNQIKPIVWVKKLGTICQEQGCTTGTISAQACFPIKDGWWQQPSQEKIKAKIKSSQIIIESSVEVLSDGNLYLSN
jgi:hypothetical protein